MTVLTEWISQVPVAVAYLTLAGAVVAESILLVGAFVPTLTLLLTAGALARAGQLDLVTVIVVAACAAMLGDAMGHRAGHMLGPRLRTSRLGRRIPAAGWNRTDRLMERCGGRAVFFSRFTPVVRTAAPYVSGAAGLPYRRIAPYSAVAALLWAGAEVGVGFGAATWLRHAVSFGGPALVGAAVLLAAVLIAAVFTATAIRIGQAHRRTATELPTA